MAIARKVRLFRNGRNQAVRIPREFELPGDEAIMRKEGSRLVIEPRSAIGLVAALQALGPLEEEFPTSRTSRPTPWSYEELSA